MHTVNLKIFHPWHPLNAKVAVAKVTALAFPCAYANWVGRCRRAFRKPVKIKKLILRVTCGIFSRRLVSCKWLILGCRARPFATRKLLRTCDWPSFRFLMCLYLKCIYTFEPVRAGRSMWRLMYIYVEGVGGGGGIVWGLFQEDTDRRLLSVYKLNCARDSGDNFFAYEKDNKEEDFELIKVNILNE